jgi:predicted DNA binding CopG/RHH family protein
MKAKQLFTDEYLAQCKKFTPDQILQFLEEFRQLQQKGTDESVLISLKVPRSLLTAFRSKSALSGVKYQTMIKKLMLEWVQGEADTNK